MTYLTIARIEVQATGNTEALTVCVQEEPAQGFFRVFVDGGLLSDGEDEYRTDNLAVAMSRAAQEATAALQGE